MNDSGSHSLAPKDAGTKDVGAKAIDFGNGTAAPHTKSYSGPKRADSEPAYSEYESFNKGANPGGNAMNISSKHDGGEKPGLGGM